MIHYALRCGSGHEFDGWFKDSASFDRQAAGGLLDCPCCSDTRVERALMAPRIGPRARMPAARAEAPPASPDATAMPSPAPAAMVAVPDHMRAVMQRIRAEVERRCDYVGPRFAKEARSIHAGEQPGRPIYGEATPAEAEALAEDGIDIARIPWVPRADS